MSSNMLHGDNCNGIFGIWTTLVRLITASIISLSVDFIRNIENKKKFQTFAVMLQYWPWDSRSKAKYANDPLCSSVIYTGLSRKIL